MIVFDLRCSEAHHLFEGWFGSSQDYASQLKRGLIACPQCGSILIEKAPMAPAVGRKGSQSVIALPDQKKDTASGTTVSPDIDASMKGVLRLSPNAAKIVEAVIKVQVEALKESRWVGSELPEQVRAMHYGEVQKTMVHGRASAKEVSDLQEEGIDIIPILFTFSDPDELI